MSVIVILILASLGTATGFLVAFIWAVRSGQYEDTSTPAMRLLMDEGPAEPLRSSDEENHGAKQR